jgi:hypothetical protein
MKGEQEKGTLATDCNNAIVSVRTTKKRVVGQYGKLQELCTEKFIAGSDILPLSPGTS